MLLGRDPERRELDRLLATARSGHSAVLALVGEAGIGKTALLGYAEENAAGLRVLRARGIESEARVPFAALLELVRPTLGLLPRIPPPQAAALEVALALRPGRAGDRFAVGAATLSLLAAYAEESPTLLLVDDAHLLDAPSAESLLFALRRLLAEPIAALLAVREGEPSLLDAADLPTITLAGLDREAAASLLPAVPRALGDRVHAATGGNPLALIELGGDAASLGAAPIDAPLPVPDTISRAFVGRAEALDEPVRRLLVLVAASDSGEIPAIERAASALGLEMADLAAAEEAGLVRVAGGRAEFRHPLARAAIYGQAPPDQRRAAHRALADALPDRDADRRAWHLAVAALGTDERAAAALEQAAARASARSAYAVAALAFERAARLTEREPRRGPLLFHAAEAAWSAGLGERALALLDEAQALGPDGEQPVAIEHLRGRIATRRGPVMEGHAILVRAAERVSDSDPDLAVTMLAEGVDACFFAGDARAMQRTAQRAEELLQARASEKARFLVAITCGMALVFAGTGEDGIAAIREAVALAEGSQELREDVQLMPWLVMGPMWLREAQPGTTPITAAIDGARARAELGVLPWLLDRVARNHAATAAWSTARIEYDEAITIARETGQEVELAAGLAGLAWLDARSGREPECRAAAAEARALCRALGVALYDTWAIRALGELELALGRPDAAVELFEEVEERLAELAIADPDPRPAAELVDAQLRLGRREDAEAVSERLAEAALAKGQPWSLARAARCRALLTESGFETCFDEALALHALTPDEFERACTQLAYGSRLRRARKRRRAREELRAALDTFASLGAEPWVALAQGELAATGETARRRDASTLDELTPQELHIAQLLAAGRTTREAAAALFLSPKTIEYHLRSIYRKLGVNSRSDLSRALAAR